MKQVVTICFTLILSNLSFSQRFAATVSKYVSDSAETTVLTDVKIIDGTGGPSKSHQTIVISNGKIVQIGDLKEMRVPQGAFTINCSGKTIIPGLVMLHEHLYYTIFDDVYFNVEEMPYTFPRMYLAAGATTIRTAGCIEPETDLNIKRMIGEGKLIGPDMDLTLPYIERKGYDIPSMNIIRDAKDAAATVDFWAERGFTSVKMYVHAQKDDLVAVMKEAHKYGIKVTGHIGTISYHEAAELGINDLEHGFMVSSDFDPNKKENETNTAVERKSLQDLDPNSPKMKDLVQYLISKKVAITSTLPVFEPYTNREVILGGGVDALLPEVKETVTARWQRSQNRDSASLALFNKEVFWEKQFYDAGGLLVCGTDPTGSGRTIAGYGSRRELELLVEGGFTSLQAIKIASLNGAIYLGREKMIGTVEKGKNADLVLINGDPEKDIHDIRKVETVFKNGVGFDSAKIFESVKGKVGMN